MTRQRNMLATAIAALSLGILFYALVRQPEHVYFLPDWLPAHASSHSLLSALGDHLPTFIHVYAFILLTMVVAAPPVSRIIPICLAWFILDCLLECAQLKTIGTWIAAHTPDWFASIPFLENTANYFLFGTFDALDLLSIAEGALAAYITILLIMQGGLTDENHP